MSAEQKPICVVIDANIWLQDSNLLLRSPMGSALIYILKTINGKIGLPSVLEEEITRNTISKGVKATEEINKKLKSISVIMRSEYPYKLPDEAEIKSAVQARITELDSLFHRVDFTWEHAQSALKRINEKTPPNQNNQQFKDSVIWEAILELLNSYIVHFVTKDGAFYQQDGKPQESTLVKKLQFECNKVGGIVYIYPDMASCLKVIKEGLPIDELNLIRKIDGLINSQLKQDLLDDPQLTFQITDLVTERSSVSAFITENAQKLALSFKLCYSCNDVYNDSGDERKDVILISKGDCLYELDTKIISDITIDFEEISWETLSGERGRRRILYAVKTGSNNLGKLAFREALDFMNNPNLSREERVKKLDLEKFLEPYTEEQRKILEIFIQIYKEEGVEALDVPGPIHYNQRFTGYNLLEIFR